MQQKTKILFDLLMAQPAGTSKFHGGGEYIKIVFKYLVNNFCDKCELIVFYDHSKFLDDWVLDLLKKFSIKSFNIKNINEIQKILDSEHLNVFYSGLPYQYTSLKIPKNVFYCGTIHGLRNIELPCDKFTYKYFEGKTSFKAFIKSNMSEFIRQKNLKNFEQSIKLLNSILCVSNHTKYAIKNFFPNINVPIYTFYTPEKRIETVSISPNNQKYILLISCDRWEKNCYRAFTALDNLFDKNLIDEYKIYTVGKIPNKIWKNIKHKERYICNNYVEPQILETLYANCDIFLYPTLNEGFGMPPQEAMKYGKTCIVSGICSLPEIYKNAVYYCNPYDIAEIENRILMAKDNKINPKIIEQQLEIIHTKQIADLEKLCKYITSEHKLIL